MFGALEYALGIYAISLVVTLLVCLVIVAIRWFSGDKKPPVTASGKSQA
ncbi:MAG: hypothetical protein ACM3SP_16425 [Chloroflexota bacterium]|jgi:hypothetical protein